MIFLRILTALLAIHVSKAANEKNAEIGQFPYYVHIASSTNLMNGCKGALIARDYALTSAICMRSILPNELIVIAGSVTLDEDDMQKIPVDDTFFHKNFTNNENDTNFDVAIVKLTQKVNLSESVNVISLPGFDATILENKKMTLVGLHYNDKLRLQFSTVHVIDNNTCMEQLRETSFPVLHESQFCVNRVEAKNQFDIPLGDLLVWTVDSESIIVGTVCKNKLAVTKIFTYIDWITDVTKSNLSIITMPADNNSAFEITCNRTVFALIVATICVARYFFD
ncbi:snake venom serine protease [Copidosoma floridanum]|uniref:snake venom serine protease n=1 Tax=Copidosoma floridanum TaxID=29053 RepID=UPI0006C9CD3D|nr:snake venom serine protease [Copidosoma floridanum]XP_014216155.1 snake venom serine protease [Copidosoma floridanum]